MIRRLIKDTAEYANDIRLTKDRDELTRTNYMLSLLNTSKQTHTFHTLPTLHFQEGTIYQRPSLKSTLLPHLVP